MVLLSAEQVQAQDDPLALANGQGDAAQFAYAADNTQLYFVLRPVIGAKPTKPGQANSATVLR